MSERALVLLAAAILPAAGFLWAAHRLHGADVAPRALAGAFLSGAATAALALFVEWGIDTAVGLQRTTSSFTVAFLAVATVEEIVKCVAIKSWFDRLGEDPTIRATLLVGAAVACGFAAAENALYAFNAPHGVEISVQRYFSAVPLHVLNGIVFATYLGLRLARPDPWAPAKGFAIVWTVHGFYDYVVFEHRLNLLLLALLFGVQAAYVGYGLREARAANLPTL